VEGDVGLRMSRPVLTRSAAAVRSRLDACCLGRAKSSILPGHGPYRRRQPQQRDGPARTYEVYVWADAVSRKVGAATSPLHLKAPPEVGQHSSVPTWLPCKRSRTHRDVGHQQVNRPACHRPDR
jgi:hypothetical protein